MKLLASLKHSSLLRTTNKTAVRRQSFRFASFSTVFFVKQGDQIGKFNFHQNGEVAKRNGNTFGYTLCRCNLHFHLNNLSQSMVCCGCFKAGNTKGGSVIVPLTSCLTGLESDVLLLAILAFIFKTDESKPVKQEVNCTVILPPLVFFV